MRILIVEDEQAIADFLRRGLESEGHSVICTGDFEGGERAALEPGVDLMIVDRMLPGGDGLDLLERVRVRRNGLPVIVLTARGEVEERIEGLDRGAIDYVTKPFSFAELAARIRARQREASPGETVIEAEGIRLDLVRRTVERDGQSIVLSAREFELLAYFVAHPGRVLSREELLRAVWRYDHDPDTNIVQVYVGYLRRKLALPGSPAPLQTVRGAGYRLAGR